MDPNIHTNACNKEVDNVTDNSYEEIYFRQSKVENRYKI